MSISNYLIFLPSLAKIANKTLNETEHIIDT